MSRAVSELALLLSRLDNVHKAGPAAFTAWCPAHDEPGPILNVELLADDSIWISCRECGAGMLWRPLSMWQPLPVVMQ